MYKKERDCLYIDSNFKWVKYYISNNRMNQKHESEVFFSKITNDCNIVSKSLFNEATDARPCYPTTYHNSQLRYRFITESMHN